MTTREPGKAGENIIQEIKIGPCSTVNVDVCFHGHPRACAHQ